MLGLTMQTALLSCLRAQSRSQASATGLLPAALSAALHSSSPWPSLGNSLHRVDEKGKSCATIPQFTSLLHFRNQTGHSDTRYTSSARVASPAATEVSLSPEPAFVPPAEVSVEDQASSLDRRREERNYKWAAEQLASRYQAPGSSPAAQPFSAKAFYVGKDLARQSKALYATAEKAQYATVWAGQDSRMLCLSALSNWNDSTEDGKLKVLPCRETFIAVFENMDTVVFFNGRGYEGKIWQRLAENPLPSRNIEEFKVVIDGGLSVRSGITEEYIALQQAEPDMVKTIAYLLAQTVALHFYEMEVDNMLKVFQDINMVMERTGEFGPAGAAGGGKEDLLKMVAKNNVMRTGILSSKIGLTKRFEAAWKDPECDRIYEHLRKEMEIDRRYDDLEVKFDLIQDNLKYFLEIIQNKKSDFLEYMIVVLIAAEIFVSLFDMWSRV